MGNSETGIAFIRYSGFDVLDKSERRKIEDLVNMHLGRIKRLATVQGLRVHLKILHQKQGAKQMPIHFIDVFLETDKGHFSSLTRNRNPYRATVEIMENLLKQIQHKHPHKSEWKEEFKEERKKRKT